MLCHLSFYLKVHNLSVFSIEVQQTVPAQIEENGRFFVSGASFKGEVNDRFDGMGGLRSRNDTFCSGKEETCLKDI